MPRTVVIDTDPGIDDAIAILTALASDAFAVAGILTVAGNIGIDKTTRNAGRLVTHARRADLPVVAGAAAPLSRAARLATEVHGEDGLGGVALPEASRPPLTASAVPWLADLLDGAPAGSVDVLALGPLTNLAQLLRARPRAAARIGRVIAMGGAVHEPGNVGPRAEFNMAADPEAADTVFRSGLRVTLVPLDVTRRVRADLAWTEALAGAGTASATLAAALIRAYFDRTHGAGSRPLHDPCVMLLALAPELFETRNLPLAVDLGSGPDAGALAVDPDGGASVEVALGVDPAGALRLLAGILGARATVP
ncbi:nucleoside hydrolase [Prosthecomicrobium sp. N25]|uniref:nucleoside hydrolase n=1 Tax=Prosthecomicrobium sp. N25 TaxID=3129254 RepID=UPI0030782BCF